MNKYVVVLSAAVLGLALTACSKSGQETTPAASTAAPAPAASTTMTAPAAGTATNAPTASTGEQASKPPAKKH